jgi:hypothetical protein
MNVGTTGGADLTDIKNIITDIFAKREPYRLSALEQVGIYFGPIITVLKKFICRKSRVL